MRLDRISIPTLAVWTWCLALLGFLAPAVVAQDALPGVFGEIIDVRVVNLEVVVTDKQGLRVSGLQPEDFRILVDGQEVPVEFFTEISGGTVIRGKEGATTAGLPSLTAGEPVGTSYLVFIDDFFSITRDRNEVLDALREDLPLLGPDDRMALVAFDGKRLEMLSSWSSNTQELERGLKQATRRDAEGLKRLAEFRNFRADTSARDPQRLFTTRRSNQLDIEEEYYARRLEEQVRRSVEAASATLRSFASPPGRKVMLVLSGGWPFQPVDYVSAGSPELTFDRTIKGGADLFRELTDTANRLGYTLYPVDVPGQQVSFTDAEDPGLGVGVTEGENVGTGTGPSFDREQEQHFALGYLARETGGRAMLNAQALDSLPKVVEDTRSYYWLGFTPTRQGDDAVHDIQVTVATKGLKVRARESFQDLSRTTEVTMMVESSLLFGNPPSTERLEVSFGKPERAGRGKVEVPVVVSFQAGQIAMLPYQDGYAAQVELRIAAVDEDGGRSEVPVIPLQLTSPQEIPAEQELRYTHSIKLRKGRQDLIVSVYDPASGALLSSMEQVRF